jgi:hypothetical protein
MRGKRPSLVFLRRRWQGRQASGPETVHKTYGEGPRAQDPAASGVRRPAKAGFARLKAAAGQEREG